MNKNLKDLGNAILKKKIYIILITLIFAITGIFYTMTNVEYRASEKFLVGEADGRIDTYKELIKGSVVLQKAIENLQSDSTVEELSHRMEVRTIKNTNMFEVTITGEDEKAMESFSKEISSVFLKRVREIYENPQIYSVDSTYQYFQKGNVVVIGSCMGVTGFILACLFFGVGFLLDNKITSCKDMEDITGLKSLISIPNIKLIEKKKLNIKGMRAHKSDVFKTLMTNIQFVNRSQAQSKTILITSAKPFEGKSYVANNLAIEFAKAGKKVIMIDADMRRGRLAKVFNLPNDLGFSNYLSSLDVNGNRINEIITRFIHDTEIKNLNVITAGNTPPNPIELLRISTVKELIKDLKVFYDIIIFDTVSVLEAPEAAVLSKVCDLTLLLSAYGKTKREEFAVAYQKIENTDGSSIGVGLNKIPDRKLKRKLVVVENVLKNGTKQVIKWIKVFLRQLKKVSKIGIVLKNGLKLFFGLLVLGLLKIKNAGYKVVQVIHSKAEQVRESIRAYQAKREKIKLIEAGSMVFEEEAENNIIKEVFESKIAEIESEDDIQYRKKLDELKTNLDEKQKNKEEMLQEEVVKPRVVQTKQVKSKFDLIREQQEKIGQEGKFAEEEEGQLEIVALQKEEAQEVKVQKQNSIDPEEIQRKHEELKEKQRMERERKEAEKKKRQEQIENYEEIDFHNQENLTEEMIRKQVEMDDLVRLAEKEKEEEQYRAQQIKIKERSQKRKERKEKFEDIINYIKNIKEVYNGKNEAKIEEKLKRESEKNEYRVRIAKEKEDKRTFRELERQKIKEELRINEELQEDNLYPRPRM